jgi:hypothetical protein
MSVLAFATDDRRLATDERRPATDELATDG